ncbi:hypothetical protein BCY91_14175 [Pelobium manganitolerans]|uniref:Uncharacterized protein n=1 Tax=Pelobium manganitolerans TaxID=1842495 RepID=A0A419S9X2_9SPHI|nr:hypothetical protein [Pelobium manganitolerans]RKD19020.1 hypothetical protein BCY91_14175 [Pelobium manganitolerans]
MNLEQKVDDLGKKVDEIYTAIMGSKFHEKGGYKSRLENVENRVEIIEDLINKWKWIAIGFVGLGGYGGLTFIAELVKFLTEKK